VTPTRPRALLLSHSLSGYYAAGVRALTERADVTLLARPPDPMAPFDYAKLDLNGAEMQVEAWPWPFALLEELVERTKPDLVYSWAQSPAVWRALRRARVRHHSVSVMFTDGCWTGSSRQRALQIGFPFIRRYAFDNAFVPGVRGAEFAHRIGFPRASVLTGVFTDDITRFSSIAEDSSARWTDPSILFVGRLVPEKGTDILAEGYRRYRDSVARPWPLHVVGRGPFDGGLRELSGVTVDDFVQPDELPGIFAGAGAFVLPSRFDSWGMVVLDACAAGLPVVVSDGCGAADDLVTPANGFTVPVGDATRLAQALTTLTGADAVQRREWGRSSAEKASAYEPQRWAETLLSVCR